jgi:Smg protein
MFEVLAYLFDTWYDAESCPDPDTLEIKLKAAGFDSEEIGDALDWLSGLAVTAETELPEAFAERESFRAYVGEETRRLSAECRGLLQFLESAGVVDPLQREIIIDRAVALPEGEMDIEKFKVLTLMVLWSQGCEPDGLILDELLPDGSARTAH